MVYEVVERDEKGRFIESDDSMSPKVLGVRLRKAYHTRFLELAKKLGKRPAELSREILEQWVDGND